MLTPEAVDAAAEQTVRGDSAAAFGERVWCLIWEYAGYLGLDPRPYTLRQLDVMVRARRREAWERISWLCCVIANHSLRHEAGAHARGIQSARGASACPEAESESQPRST